MIDLDALRQSRDVTWKLARQNLASLDHFFWLRSSRTDRYRFLKAYLEAAERNTTGCRRGCAPDRGHDPPLGGAALAALGTALPVRRTSTSRSFRPNRPGASRRATSTPI